MIIWETREVFSHLLAMADIEKAEIEAPSTSSEATTRPTSREAITERVRQVSISSSPAAGDDDDLERQNTHISLAESIRQVIGSRPGCFKNTAQEVSFVAQATVAMASNPFLTGATSTVTATIGRELGMTQGQVSWIAASTTLAAGSFQLALGQLSDLLGRRMLFLWGMGSYAVFVLLVGFAQNPFWMDVVLGVLGVSSAMIVPPAGGILGAAYGKPSKRKNLAFSAFTAGKSLGTVAGSITCGIAARLFNVSEDTRHLLTTTIMNENANFSAVARFILLHRHPLRCLLPARSVGGPERRGFRARRAPEAETFRFR